MNNTERFTAVLNGLPADRLPVIEWASWWDQTREAWYAQGIPSDLEGPALNDYWGHDPLIQYWLPIRESDCPAPKSFGGPIMENADDYRDLKRYLYTDHLLREIEQHCIALKQRYSARDTVFWFSMDGFFWFPRTLFGIEGHLYSFYDEPELLLQINADLTAYHKKCLEIVYAHLEPKFMTLAEDMSYNLGPMLSREQYNTFMLPFYKELVPVIKQGGAKVFIDTDGQVEPLIPWFLDGGIEGILPLERMAGVDVNRIREKYPELLMIGGFDKTVMHNGEAAMRAEFERLLPAILSGRYIPSVDHQTPPDVTSENYKIYMRLLREYAARKA